VAYKNVLIAYRKTKDPFFTGLSLGYLAGFYRNACARYRCEYVHYCENYGAFLVLDGDGHYDSEH